MSQKNASEEKAFQLSDVLKQELAEINRARRSRAENHADYGDARNPAQSPDGPIPGITPIPDWQTRNTGWVETIAEAHRANLVGLAFSGGGIRSATYNLGVLQALSELKLLSRIDYLSTVSGGGFIGGWLEAWTSRQGSIVQVEEQLTNFDEVQFGTKTGSEARVHVEVVEQLRERKEGLADVENMLTPYRVNQEEDNEPPQIRFLRVFSNYLTPKLGLFSGDTLAATAVVLRNVFLNQLPLFAGLAILLLLPRLAVEGGEAFRRHTTTLDMPSLVLASVLAFVMALVMMGNMIPINMTQKEKPSWVTKEGWILAMVGLPLFLSAMLGALWLVNRQWTIFSTAPIGPVWQLAIVVAAAYGSFWLLAIVIGLGLWGLQQLVEIVLKEERPESSDSANRREILIEAGCTLIAALFAGALAGCLYAVLWTSTSGLVVRNASGWVVLSVKPWGVEQILTFGLPLILGIVLLTGTVHIGLIGKQIPDFLREWWGRLGGWLLLSGALWLGVFSLTLFFPHFIANSSLVKDLAEKYLTPTWIVTTLAGLWAAAKGDTSGKPGELTWKDWLAKSAPFIFVVGLLCWMSYGIDWLWQLIEGSGGGSSSSHIYLLIAACCGCAIVVIAFSWRVDINEFSMHRLYRNRLVRCYLGASNNRSPNQFTGFDKHDDVPLSDLRVEKGYDGPLPLLNACLNLLKGEDLAWQERKAASFVMTPLCCGYDVWLEEQDSPLISGERNAEQRENGNSLPDKSIPSKRGGTLERFGFRPTKEFASESRSGEGISLGAAMAISGAAASPNMGSYTKPSVKFLMTLFNVRLGQWLGNPHHIMKWKKAGPGFGLLCLLKELFVGTSDDSDYVHLSDGGHFDNMGLYELVKRRCGLIILCDAEGDAKYEFGGLGNAIRMCRIDMGIDIDLDVKDISPQKNGEPSKKHYAVGKIHYEMADLNAPTGTILYFKASFTGDEPRDVKAYHEKTKGAFPHESLAHQWFSESQFEAYRELGYHEIKTSILVGSHSNWDLAEEAQLMEWWETSKHFGINIPGDAA